MNAGARAAERYVGRVVDACLALEAFPRRGVQRDDLEAGVRMLGFERRVLILYRIDESVRIGRVLYGGRDVNAAMAEDRDQPDD